MVYLLCEGAERGMNDVIDFCACRCERVIVSLPVSINNRSERILSTLRNLMASNNCFNFLLIAFSSNAIILILFFQSVSFADEGIYNCFSRGVRSKEFAIRAVRMIVQKDWEEVYENDSGVSIKKYIFTQKVIYSNTIK